MIHRGVKCLNDEAIIELYLRRQESAITATRERYGARLRHLAFSLTGDEGAAEECENDVYLEAWNSIPPHEPRDYFYPFIARIARHRALNRCRDEQRCKRKASAVELSLELEQCVPAGEDPAEALEEKELGALLNRFLSLQRREKRVIFLRRYWYRDSIATIAADCGISESKVKSVLFRLRQALRSYLEKEGYTV